MPVLEAAEEQSVKRSDTRSPGTRFIVLANRAQ